MGLLDSILGGGNDASGGQSSLLGNKKVLLAVGVLAYLAMKRGGNAQGAGDAASQADQGGGLLGSLGGLGSLLGAAGGAGALGSLLGGAGGLESVFTVLALHNNVSPPTINIFNQDPECDLDYCANTARDMKIDVAVKNNFGFGGTNGTLVFKRV